MIASRIRFLLTAFAMCIVSQVVNAAVPVWQIVPKDSSISFSAIQNNSPVSGKFDSFTGEIHFDPAELKESHVRIVIDIASVTTSYKEVGDTLKTSDWFDVKLFPQAIFKAKDFMKTGNNTYQANGTLTIRDKTQPIILVFVLEEYSATNARVKGSATIKRTLFGLGKGDWAKTDAVKDDVQVSFSLTAIKK